MIIDKVVVMCVVGDVHCTLQQSLSEGFVDWVPFPIDGIFYSVMTTVKDFFRIFYLVCFYFKSINYVNG